MKHMHPQPERRFSQEPCFCQPARVRQDVDLRNLGGVDRERQQ